LDADGNILQEAPVMGDHWKTLDRNVDLDVRSIKDVYEYNAYTIKPVIKHADPEKHAWLLENRPNTHTQGIFAWNGTYIVDLTEGGGGGPIRGPPPPPPGTTPLITLPPETTEKPGMSKQTMIMIAVAILVCFLVAGGASFMMMMMR
jgi:hypothetical protein